MVNREDAMGPRIERLPRGRSYVLSQTYFCERPSLFAKTIHPTVSYFKHRKMVGAKDSECDTSCGHDGQRHDCTNTGEDKGRIERVEEEEGVAREKMVKQMARG